MKRIDQFTLEQLRYACLALVKRHMNLVVTATLPQVCSAQLVQYASQWVRN